jgi:cytochrome c5
MVNKILAAAVMGSILYSCSPKVVVGAQKPDPVQVPTQLPSMAETTAPPMDLAVGRSLYENKCAKCHKLFSPTDYSKEDWGPILVRMQKKAAVEDADMAQINNYIFSHLKS